ncbi:hypothetical protein PFISCL1PPCAC_22692, partial [Pristionchus fissidentatus]
RLHSKGSLYSENLELLVLPYKDFLVLPSLSFLISLAMIRNFVLISFVTMCAHGWDTVCPDGHVCPEVQTCCPSAYGGYKCCPFVAGTCCPDGLRCCPFAFECDSDGCYETGNGSNTTAPHQLSDAVKIVHRSNDDNY